MSDTEDIVVIENHPRPSSEEIGTPQSNGAHRGFRGPRTSLTAGEPEADYYMQLMLLEQQNKKRLLMARQEQDRLSRGPPMPISPPTMVKDAASNVEEPPAAIFSPPSSTQTLSERKMAPCAPETASPQISVKATAPATSSSSQQGPTPTDGNLQAKYREENTANGKKSDSAPAVPLIGKFWSPPQPLPGVFGPCPPECPPDHAVPPPLPSGASHMVPQRAPYCPPPPPMPFSNAAPPAPYVFPPAVKKGINKGMPLPMPPPPPPPTFEVVPPPIPATKYRKYACRLHYTDGSKCRATFSTYAARRNHEAIHYDTRAHRRGRAKDRFDSDVDSVASWDDSDSEASDCEFDSSDRAVRLLSYKALLRCGDNGKDSVVTFEPFGRNVYVTSHPATVVDFKKFLPFLRHADLESWYVYPTNQWLSKNRTLEAAGCELTPMVPVERPTPAALDWPTIAVTAALKSDLEDELGDCDVDPDSNECETRSHRFLPSHKSLQRAKDQLVYYSIVSTVVGKAEYDSAFPPAPTVPSNTSLFKVVRTGSREAAASHAFLDAGARGWSTVFTCIVRAGAEVAKLGEADYVRVEQCSDVVGKSERKHDGREMVFY